LDGECGKVEKELLLDMKGIDKSFPEVHALRGVDFSVRKGEVHALMGENGAGKSTLIKVLTGIYEKDGGFITFRGRDISPRNPLEAQQAGISTIYQELNLVPFLPVYENIFVGREPITRLGIVKRDEMARRAYDVLGDMGIHIDVTEPLNSYSMAIQQMVAIARAITVNAKLVIMDEPTSSLDAKEVEVLFSVVRRLIRKNIAVVFISHRLDEVFEIAERVTVLKDGQLVGEFKVSELDQLTLVSHMIGREAKDMERKKFDYRYADAEQLAEMSDIRQGIRLSGIDIDIKKGEILGLAGLLGSGRTELAKILFGAEIPDDGEIIFMGRGLHLKAPKDAIDAGMGFCTEDRKIEGIIPHLSVKENITIAMLPQICRFGIVSGKKQDEIVRRFIERLDIKTPSPKQTLRNLSGGNQQKVLLSRWLCLNPKLIILDEPTRGIDVGTKAEIENLIQELSNAGISVLMISSEIAELERNCDRVAVMREGQKLGELTGIDISQNNIMELIARGRRKFSEEECV
jgi:ABC-type sugar transport system ATPase subunit